MDDEALAQFPDSEERVGFTMSPDELHSELTPQDFNMSMRKTEVVAKKPNQSMVKPNNRVKSIDLNLGQFSNKKWRSNSQSGIGLGV